MSHLTTLLNLKVHSHLSVTVEEYDSRDYILRIVLVSAKDFVKRAGYKSNSARKKNLCLPWT